MTPIELLSPAKNLETGLAAINYGADAVYIGAPKFGARSAAGNSIHDIEKLIRYAHTYRSRVYAAVNTILYENELQEAEKTIHQLYQAGIDAIIIQDMGILEMDLPPVQLHASTQTHNFELERIKFLDKIGFSRIVLARELPWVEIQKIRSEIKAEIEFFIHGALCVSLSGQCYLSQAQTGRSANRGECSQLCRLPYSILDGSGRKVVNNKHLLSLKDLNLSKHIEQLIQAGVCSLKIEGRLKEIGYVKNITAHYRTIIDQILEKDSRFQKASSGKTHFLFKPDPEISFNRGFTDYFIEGRKEGISSIHTPKSMGKHMGEVIKTGKRTFETDSTEDFHNGDGICFLNSRNELIGTNINKVEGRTIEPASMEQIVIGQQIFRNYDHEFTKKLESDKSKRSISAKMRIEETPKGFQLTAEDEDGFRTCVQLEMGKTPAEKAEKAETNIKKQLSKSGESIFEINEIEISFSRAFFIQASSLNEMRREALAKLEEERLSGYQRPEQELSHNEAPYPTSQESFRANISNSLAERFYRKHGVDKIEKAFELQTKHQGQVLMETKLCLKYELGICSKAQRAPKLTDSEKLQLEGLGTSFELEFDCKRCVMQVKQKT